MLAGLDLPADVRALSEESGFAELEPELRYVVRTIAHVPARPVVALLGRRFQRETTFTLQDACGLRAVAHASRPMLFIHGQEDVYVRPRAAVELYRACSSPASLLLIPGAGHCAAARTAPEEFFSHLDDFYDCYA